MSQELLFSQEGHLGIITLNRPKSLNALTLDMILELQKQLHSWKQDTVVHAIVIKACAGPVFCAGGDVRWLYESGFSDPKEQLTFFWHEYRLNHFIHHLGKPYIALMDGITMGGGVGISLHGSHPVASEKFVFAMPETGIGFFPDVGASYILNKCSDAFGIYLGLTGSRLNHHQAKQAGLSIPMVQAAQMPDLVHCLTQADLSQDSYGRVDACIKSYSTTVPNQTDLPNTLINICFSQPSLELIIKTLEKSEDVGAQEIIAVLAKKSPLSLKVTLDQLQRAKGKSLEDCLTMDYTLAQHFMHDKDFYEGVRALLVDKDKNPKWHPSTLKLVSQDTVFNYFTHLSELKFIS
ncbi:MAG: enoyl-CoA hydratase/isomerase family protein [Legionella sp.]|nr:enoyl-CoA hydratase/isomerase family protein [Legionella sp.]